MKSEFNKERAKKMEILSQNEFLGLTLVLAEEISFTAVKNPFPRFIILKLASTQVDEIKVTPMQEKILKIFKNPTKINKALDLFKKQNYLKKIEFIKRALKNGILVEAINQI